MGDVTSDAGEPASAAESGSAPDLAAASMRWPELAVAALLMGLAALVIVDSVRVGNGWAEDGPRAGYFPFYIGLVLLAASAFIFVTTLVRWRRLDAAFVMRSELAGVWAVLWPSAVYVGVMPWAGLYLASALLIGYFMRRHGRYGWLQAVLVSLGVTVTLFVIFERWFLVPLPKGPIEQALGF